MNALVLLQMSYFTATTTSTTAFTAEFDISKNCIMWILLCLKNMKENILPFLELLYGSCSVTDVS